MRRPAFLTLAGGTILSGHVTPRKLPKGALGKDKNDFVIQLPSKAPVPTPAVYQDKVYVSGGFHSKEFYCVSAISGELEWGFDDPGIADTHACGTKARPQTPRSITVREMDAVVAMRRPQTS